MNDVSLDNKWIGQRTLRPDGIEKVTGSAQYAADYAMPGMVYGKTDELGHRAVENVVTPNDYHATLLHLFGLDWQKLVYHHKNRSENITSGRPARVVSDILTQPPTEACTTIEPPSALSIDYLRKQQPVPELPGVR